MKEPGLPAGLFHYRRQVARAGWFVSLAEPRFVPDQLSDTPSVRLTELGNGCRWQRKGARRMSAQALPAPVFTIGDNTTELDIAALDFQARQVDGSEPYLISDHFKVPIAPLAVLPPDAVVQRAVSTVNTAMCFATTPIGSLMVGSRSLTSDVWVSAASLHDANTLIQFVRSKVPKDGDDWKHVTLRTWHVGDHGPEYDDRRVAAPDWADIEHNYPGRVARQFRRVVEMTGPTDSGRLILLHGPPGSGKSTAIRTLAKEWRTWCATNIVTDPEYLFRSPNYLNRVVRERVDRAARPCLDRLPEAEMRWRLIVAEDTDEYLRATARSGAGASLGRLLNLTDGINSDSHKALVVLTTNEPVANLHPALTRPGRCLAQIEFGRFTAAEARRWLPAGIEPPIGQSSLAELLRLRGDIEQLNDNVPDSERAIGTYL